MAGVYQRSISQYQIETEPLRLLKKKDQEFIWNGEQQQAFEKLKKDLCLLPILGQPDFSLVFELHCDAATKAGIAVILCQRYENTPYPLAYASRSLTPAEQNYLVQELECLAVVFGFKKFRQFLECGSFLVYTDHSSLQWVLNTKEDKQASIWRWCMFLQSYDFKVIYVPGKTNQAADALSRHPLPATIQTLQQINWIQEQEKDKNIQDIKKQSKKNPSFIVNKNILYKVVKNNRDVTKNHLYVVVPKEKTQDIIKEFHDSAFAGHFSYLKTRSKILQNRFWWKDMDKQIKQYCSNCKHCQEVKCSKNNNMENLGKTNGVHPFQRVAIDFWGPLPEALFDNNKYRYILVIIDTYTKFVELYTVASTSSEEIARTFHHNFILKHGVPEENLYTPAYHPQSNEIVERFMATLRRMILSYTEQDIIKDEWNKDLRLIQFVYNNTVHSSTGFTPFFLVHGRHPRTPLITADENKIYDHYQSPPQEFAIDLQQRLNCAFEMVDHFLNAKQTQTQANPFQVGQQVLVFNQSLSTKKKPRKLMFDWIGSFLVTSTNSKSSVDLKNINTNKIIKNIHVSRIKIFKQSNLAQA
ncbi:hypothetical protein G6F56_008884 [Rhizopus delemar]|nr:hypothetical protein G6F56_008884 [Rhizopus delemar]